MAPRQFNESSTTRVIPTRKDCISSPVVFIPDNRKELESKVFLLRKKEIHPRPDWFTRRTVRKIFTKIVCFLRIYNIKTPRGFKRLFFIIIIILKRMLFSSSTLERL